MKKRIAASLWFRSVDGALRTIQGYEAMNMIRKGQVSWLPKAISLCRAASLRACSGSLHRRSVICVGQISRVPSDLRQIPTSEYELQTQLQIAAIRG